jgi:predicted DCC family thiol-disulfide oxidoreductase YuxK
MSKLNKHLVFYDGTCGLCDHVVQFLLKADHKQQFLFAPLQGVTAAKVLKNLPDSAKGEDSLVLIENYQTEELHKEPRYYIMGKAVLRICWLLGGGWLLLGWMFFLPQGLFNVMYRYVAKNRKRFFKNDSCFLPDPSQRTRFLP